MSLANLIKLAKRTGHTIIVHDPLDGDYVVMGVNAYEQLFDQQRTYESRQDDLSFLDAPSKSQVESAFWGEEEESELEPWHRAGDVIDDRYGPDEWEDDNDHEFDDEVGGDGYERLNFKDEIKIDDIPFGPPWVPEQPESVKSEFDRWHEDAGSLTKEPTFRINQFNSSARPGVEDWPEEPLGEEELVFYEEPV